MASIPNLNPHSAQTFIFPVITATTSHLYMCNIILILWIRLMSSIDADFPLCYKIRFYMPFLYKYLFLYMNKIIICDTLIKQSKSYWYYSHSPTQHCCQPRFLFIRYAYRYNCEKTLNVLGQYLQDWLSKQRCLCIC